jgi:hypothetical protein
MYQLLRLNTVVLRRDGLSCPFPVISAVWLAFIVIPCAALGQTGMDRIGSARGVALGHAATADPFSNGLHVNPAVPAASDRPSATFFARQPFGLADLRHASASASLPTRWFSIQSGAGTFGFEAYRETFATVGISRTVPVGASRPVYVGMRATVHHLSISEYGSDGALAADAGLLVPVLPVLTLGVHARNVGGGSIAESPLPRSLAVGLHYAVGPNVRILADVVKDVAYPWSLRGGVEISPVEVLSLRLGATRHPARFTAGVGVDLGPVRADVAGERHPRLGWSPSGGLTLSL